MRDIYQRIWDADQQEHGLPALRPNESKDAERGYVVVDESGAGRSHRVLADVHIPDAKRDTYELAKRLFNNYTLDQTKPELNTPEEDEEVRHLLQTTLDTSPMRVAQEYVARQLDAPISDHAWYQMLWDVWFRQFDDGHNRDLSGFEHVIVGEQKGSKAQGYHFWYKYHLDESTDFLQRDDIAYHGTRYRGPNAHEGVLVPEVVTISYKWDAFDYDAGARRPLTKPIGGFWVGCSIEGLMALGAVRCLPRVGAPKQALINGALYNLKVFRSPDARSMRTFYPEFVDFDGRQGHDGEPQPAPLKAARIVAALVNPVGTEEGHETVTVINPTPAALDLNGWRIEDRLERSETLSGPIVGPGETTVVQLTGRGARLTNSDASISLLDPEGRLVHRVTYVKAQARREGWSIVF
jgi:hypothetical protein